MSQIRFIKNNAKDFGYPIGSNIQINKQSINALKRVMKQTIGPKKHITLWCRGSSGAIIAGIVSLGFPNSTINHVKKVGESSHSRGQYTLKDNTINIIIDDFSNTGETLNAIYEDIISELDIPTIDYVCVVGRLSIPRLSFVPKNIIGKFVYVDRSENKEVRESCFLEKYKISNNYKVVGEKEDVSISKLDEDYLTDFIKY